MEALEISNLSIKFGNQVVFDKASIKIKDSGFYCLMGRNGCGKSTLFKAILKKIIPSSGIIKVFNNEQYDNVGYCMADPLVFENLTALENLLLINSDLKRINEIAIHFGIEKILNEKAKKLSAGEKQKLCVIRTILSDNDIMLFDEATSHLDDHNSKIVLDYLKKLSKNHIIIYSTHYEYEANEYADKYIFIKNHKIFLENKNETANVTQTNKENHINKKILRKIVSWKLEWPFSILHAILFSLCAIFIWLFSLNTYTVYMQYQQKANCGRYSQVEYINRYYEFNDNYNPNKYLSDEDLNDLIEMNSSFQNAYIIGNNLLNTIYGDYRNFDSVLIDDTLNDNEIIIDQNDYDFFYEKGFIEENKITYYDIKLKIISTLASKINLSYLIMNLNTLKELQLQSALNSYYNIFDTPENSNVNLTYGRLPINENEIALSEENLYYYEKVPLEIGGFTVIKKKHTYEEISEYNVSIFDVNKTFKVVGFYDKLINNKTGIEKNDGYVITKNGCKFIYESKQFYIGNMENSIYIDNSKVTTSDIEYILKNDMFLKNDIYYDAYQTVNFYNSIKKFVNVLMMFIVTFTLMVLFFYFYLWKHENKNKYILLNYICKINQPIKLFIEQKVKACVLTIFLFFVFYFILKYEIDNALTRGLNNFITNKDYIVCDFSTSTYIIITFIILLFIEIISTLIMARRYVYDNVKSYQ